MNSLLKDQLTDLVPDLEVQSLNRSEKILKQVMTMMIPTFLMHSNSLLSVLRI